MVSLYEIRDFLLPWLASIVGDQPKTLHIKKSHGDCERSSSGNAPPEAEQSTRILGLSNFPRCRFGQGSASRPAAPTPGLSGLTKPAAMATE